MVSFKSNTVIKDMMVLENAYVLLKMKRPDGFDFSAGQYTKLFFPDTPERPIYLSIASSPGDEDLELCIATKDAEVLERYLKAFDSKTGLYLDSADGKFLLPGVRANKYVFVAGGSGVSPVRSMCLDVVDEAESVSFILGGSAKNVLPYFPEFQALEKECSHFSFHPCVEEADTDAFHGNTVDFLQHHQAQLPGDALYFLCGPKPMLDSFVKVAKEIGIAEDRIFFERY